jgi:hypothetical protein
MNLELYLQGYKISDVKPTWQIFGIVIGVGLQYPFLQDGAACMATVSDDIIRF